MFVAPDKAGRHQISRELDEREHELIKQHKDIQ